MIRELEGRFLFALSLDLGYGFEWGCKGLVREGN